MALANCVICTSTTREADHVRSLVEQLGGRYTDAFNENCTHLVSACEGSFRCRIASTRPSLSYLRVVHPRFLWACWWSGYLVPWDRYLLCFVKAASRTGTCTSLGSYQLFLEEVPLYYSAQALRNPVWGTGPNWGRVSRLLQNTVFWGKRVRNMNWRRRSASLLLLRWDVLPEELWRVVVRFI
jgi:hypothetical protein